jgi:DNA-binding CsgD family transcriptional regulator
VAGTVVGRDAELGLVDRFLDHVSPGPAALVIEGEAGIGKTTVWLEGITAAGARGFRVLQAHPAESEAKLSYAALADLVGGAFDQTRAALPAPQERALGAALLRTEADEPADARTTATAVVGVLTALAADGPVLVAVDDVQWLDPASARTLEFAARRLPPRLGLLVTRRTDGVDEAPLGLDRALPENLVGRVVPGPLSLAALHHVVRSRLGTSLPRPLLARLAAVSGGNPFFALEIARALARDRSDRALGDPLPVPPNLQQLVASRIRALSTAAQEAVLIAASLFRPSVTTVSEALAPALDAEPALLEAEEAGVLVVSEHGRIRFGHPLLAAVVSGSATPQRRRQLHRRLADVVADREERARHLAQSTTRADEATAAEVEQAARGARLRGAHDAAAELFEAARRLTPGGRPDDLARRLIGEAEALLAVDDLAGARSRAESAVATSTAPSMTGAALSLLGSVEWADGALRRGVDCCQQALTAAAGDRDLEAQVSMKLARFYTLLDPQRAADSADAAMRLLSEEREPELLARALIDRFWADVLLGRGARRELLQRGLELEARVPTRNGMHPIPLIWFHSVDEFDAARARYAAEDEWFRERGEEASHSDRLAQLALVELRAGQWDLAERYVDASCGAIAPDEARGPRAMRFALRSLIDAHRGKVERARRTLVPLIDAVERTEQNYWAALTLSYLSFAEFAAGNNQAVDQVLTRMRGRLDAIGIKDAVVIDRSEPYHIESLVALGERDRARDVLARLEERGRTLPRLWISATLPRARALILADDGDVAGALAILEQAPEVAELPFELGWTLLVKGQLYRRANQKRAAADALWRAVETFERLGAPSWIDRARGELARVGLRQRSADELTATEQRVAELAAGGMTNREVAKAAFISPKTVEANLARVYRKLGIRSRAELGARIALERRDIEAQT